MDGRTDRRTDGRTENHLVIAITLCLCFVVRLNTTASLAGQFTRDMPVTKSVSDLLSQVHTKHTACKISESHVRHMELH